MTRYYLASALAICLCLRSADAETGSLLANKTPATDVAQTGSQASEIGATLKTIKLPEGFKISLFALVPDARAMAVSADGRKVFVGTNESEAYVLDLKGQGGPVSYAKTFAPSIGKAMPHGVCFGPDKTLYLAERNRILAFPGCGGTGRRTRSHRACGRGAGQADPTTVSVTRPFFARV